MYRKKLLQGTNMYPKNFLQGTNMYRKQKGIKHYDSKDLRQFFCIFLFFCHRVQICTTLLYIPSIAVKIYTTPT